MAKNDSLTIYFDPESTGNLKSLMKKLASIENSVYHGRKYSEIGRRVLEKYLPKEIELERRRLTGMDEEVA